MSRLKPVDPASATGASKEALDKVQKSMGRIPNIFLAMGNSPAALNGYLNFSEALASGTLSPKLREQIAITVAEADSCQYCLSAHVAIGKSIGMTDDEIYKAKDSDASDPKSDAGLNFARNMILRRGQLTDYDLEILRTTGWTDGEISELVANIALHIFTNYFNLFNETEIDFPKVEMAFPA